MRIAKEFISRDRVLATSAIVAWGRLRTVQSLLAREAMHENAQRSVPTISPKAGDGYPEPFLIPRLKTDPCEFSSILFITLHSVIVCHFSISGAACNDFMGLRHRVQEPHRCVDHGANGKLSEMHFASSMCEKTHSNWSVRRYGSPQGARRPW